MDEDDFYDDNWDYDDDDFYDDDWDYDDDDDDWDE